MSSMVTVEQKYCHIPSVPQVSGSVREDNLKVVGGKRRDVNQSLVKMNLAVARQTSEGPVQASW